MCFGAASFWLMPRTPQDASFLTSEEKQYVSEVLQGDGVVAADAAEDDFSWRHVIETLKKPHVLVLCVAGFFNGASCVVCAFEAFVTK